jgi:hypothetical protein
VTSEYVGRADPRSMRPWPKEAESVDHRISKIGESDHQRSSDANESSNS